MATTVVYPSYTEPAAFTRAQWKELERQAMIYKYMVASVPVPPHLLSSDFTTATATSLGHGYSSIFNLKYGDNKDAEPGRCKRTDGKKWRCSRDVAPQQKYCERHMHRGRPRSRKPVEPRQQQVSSSPKTNKKTRLVSTATLPPASPRLQGSTNELTNNHPPSLLLKSVTETEDVSLSLFTQHSQNRELEWMMESNKMMSMETSEQQWQQMMSQGSVYNTSTADPSIFQHDNYGVEEQQLSLLSLPQIGNSNTDDYSLFINPYNPPRDFIDAWSNDDNLHSENTKNDSCSGVNNGNLSPCSLNLSMAMGVHNSEMGQIQMLEEGSDTSQRCSWLSPVSWMVSAPGGPLAEVLRPSSVIVNSNPGSPCAGKNCDAISPQATSASSPSGVLHRTMLSLSDNSVCNSPTVAAAPEMVGFQWLN